jgi:hypothetical protein
MELQPGNVLAVTDYARALGNLGRIDQMSHYLVKALELEPDNPFAKELWGRTQIRDGNYMEGFLNREARWGTSERNRMVEELPLAWWRGESLKGKRLLVFCETSWGLGDSIQYARYLPPLCERAQAEGGLVLLCSHTELEGFYRRNFSDYSDVLIITSLSEKIRPARAFDSLPASGPLTGFIKTAARSLPLIFGGPAANEFPYLRPERERVAAWRAKIDACSAPGLKIGVAWTGRDDHPRQDLRDYQVGVLAQALSGCGVKLYSLQLGHSEAAKALGLIDWTAELSSIDETAASLVNLDLVISLDGMIAHLSGALGIPTWVLVDLSPHYTWMAKGNSTPWYGSVRVFRQQKYKNWTSVFDEVRAALRGLAPKADSPSQAFDTIKDAPTPLQSASSL